MGTQEKTQSKIHEIIKNCKDEKGKKQVVEAFNLHGERSPTL